MPWESYEQWSEAEKQSLAKRADEVNKVWTKKNEQERRERVGNALNLDQNKSEINSESLPSGSKSSIDEVSVSKI